MLTITPGPLPDDGTEIEVRDTLTNFVNNTDISGIDFSAFQGSKLNLVVSATDPPATELRNRGTLWFKRGQGTLYQWLIDANVTEANVTNTQGMWRRLSDGKEFFALVSTSGVSETNQFGSTRGAPLTAHQNRASQFPFDHFPLHLTSAQSELLSPLRPESYRLGYFGYSMTEALFEAEFLDQLSTAPVAETLPPVIPKIFHEFGYLQTGNISEGDRLYWDNVTGEASDLTLSIPEIGRVCTIPSPDSGSTPTSFIYPEASHFGHGD